MAQPTFEAPPSTRPIWKAATIVVPKGEPVRLNFGTALRLAVVNGSELALVTATLANAVVATNSSAVAAAAGTVSAGFGLVHVPSPFPGAQQ